ncbi:hypothetical protein WJX79_002339 [Trebouxia sp. C0005]
MAHLTQEALGEAPMQSRESGSHCSRRLLNRRYLNSRHTLTQDQVSTGNVLLQLGRHWLSISSYSQPSFGASLFLSHWQVGKVDPRYPVGKTRLQTVAVIACAVIMSFATLAVIQESGKSLYTGIATGIPPDLDMTWLLYIILGVAAGLKGWWIDPVGGILISLYIIYSWGAICKEQVDKMIGKGAPEDFIHDLEQLASTHHADMSLDHIRAYYFGQRFIVEMEVVLPPRMTVRESHDIAMILQHKLEALEEVERAFVHVDYTKRDEPEHKVERNLMSHPKDLMLPHQDVAESSGTAAEVAEQSKKAAELHDHLQQSNSVSDQAKRAAKEAMEADVPDANGDENV